MILSIDIMIEAQGYFIILRYDSLASANVGIFNYIRVILIDGIPLI